MNYLEVKEDEVKRVNTLLQTFLQDGDVCTELRPILQKLMQEVRQEREKLKNSSSSSSSTIDNSSPLMHDVRHEKEKSKNSSSSSSCMIDDSSDSRKREIGALDEDSQPSKHGTRSRDNNSKGRVVWNASDGSHNNEEKVVKEILARRRDNPNNKCLIIGVHTDKGGVGKTTVVCNIAAACAYAGLDAAITDLDTQCNTTSCYKDSTDGYFQREGELLVADASSLMAMGNNPDEIFVKSDSLAEKSQFSKMAQFVTEATGNPMAELFKEAFEGVGGAQALKDILHDKNRPCMKKCNPEFFGDRLLLLEGSPIINKYDSQIGRGFEEAHTPQLAARHTGFISYIVNTLADFHKRDVMFIDLGPSQSNLNKSAVLCCDYILPPVNAGLYSCVSVHGLLTSVLKGKSGWLASHKRMVDIQYSDEFVSSYPSVLEWRLPLNPPVLLPFLVSNYALEKKGKGAKKEVEGTLFHSSTQFVNTMTQFINEDEFDGPVKVLYKRNGGRMVIPFLCSLDAMSACEELGRPLVEVTRKHLVDYWQNDLKKKRSNAKLEKLKECPHFEEEVAVGKERYLSLAEWIIQLVDEKNSKA